MHLEENSLENFLLAVENLTSAIKCESANTSVNPSTVKVFQGALFGKIIFRRCKIFHVKLYCLNLLFCCRVFHTFFSCTQYISSFNSLAICFCAQTLNFLSYFLHFVLFESYIRRKKISSEKRDNGSAVQILYLLF